MMANETAEHWTDAVLHRIRGEILLKCDPANTAPAEEAFLTAIAVAQQQKAQSFELQAALSLAKLYRSHQPRRRRPCRARPRARRFSPTPELPEIAEAQTLLAALAESDEVKNAAASRQRRLKLQTSYGQAILWWAGYTVPETKAAFARAGELARQVENAADRFSAYYGQWVAGLTRGEIGVGARNGRTVSARG